LHNYNEPSNTVTFPQGGSMAPLILSPRQRLELEYLASHTPVSRERSRAQALLWLDEGETAGQVAEALRVSRRTVYYWADRFHERSGLDLRQRLADAPRPGRPRTGDGGVDSWIAEVIDADPRALGYHSTTWTAPLLVRHLRDHHDIEVSCTTVSRAIARLGIRWKRPRHQLSLRPATWRQSKGG
jgi:transposase